MQLRIEKQPLGDNSGFAQHTHFSIQPTMLGYLGELGLNSNAKRRLLIQPDGIKSRFCEYRLFQSL